MTITLEYIESGLLAFVAMVLYWILIGSVVPRVTMRLQWKKQDLAVRGIRRVTFPGGRGVVYQPEPHVRRYVRQYAIFSENGDKYLRCQLDPRVKHMRYDVVSFTAGGKLLDMISVDEQITHEGKTQMIALPTKTAYAYIIPRQIDDAYENSDAVVSYRKAGMVWFVILTVILTALMSFFLYQGLDPIFDKLIKPYRSVEGITVILRGLLFGAGVALLGLLSFRKRMKKVINK